MGVGVEVEVVHGMHAEQRQGSWLHVGICQSTSRVRGDTLMTPNHTAVQVLTAVLLLLLSKQLHRSLR